MAEIELYTTAEVANILHCTRRTIYNYINANQISATIIGKQWLITRDALDDFIKRGLDDTYMEITKDKKYVPAKKRDGIRQSRITVKTDDK